MTPRDPAYEYELAALEEACREYLAAREAGQYEWSLMLCGNLIAHLASVYKLAPPAGIVDVPAMFRRETR